MNKPALDRQTTKRLEAELERAIAHVIEQHDDDLPIGPDQPTMHLMAKAAVAAYEAAAHHARRG